MVKQGQAWSMDLVVGVLIFLLVAGIIYSLLIDRDSNDVGPLRLESEVIATKLTADSSGENLAVAENNVLDSTKLVELADKDYEQLKSELGVQREFCVFLTDDSGNLVYIAATGKKFNGVGSNDGNYNLSGVPCGAEWDSGAGCWLDTLGVCY